MQTHRAPIVCWYRVHGVVDLRRYVLSHVLSSLSFSLSPLVVTQIRGQMAGFSPPYHYSSCLAFFCEKDCIHLFHPSSTRVELGIYQREALSEVVPVLEK